VHLLSLSPRLAMWLCLIVLTLATLGCGDMINPERQKELGVHAAVLEQYNTATGFHTIIGPPKFPGLRKSASLNVEILDDSDPEKLEEAMTSMLEWYAQHTGKMTGLKKIWIYGMKDKVAVKVAIYEAGAISGKDMLYADATPEYLPAPGE